MKDQRRILLLSSSTIFRSGYLDHAEPEIRDFLGGIRRVLFFPFALADHEAYADKAQKRFGAMHCELDSLHRVEIKTDAIQRAPAIFVGGGNTFRLLKLLYELDLLDVIRERVLAGMPYLAASAGSNLAGPTIRTTNDMPIVEPPSFRALGIVPFQINPHYLDADPGSTHMGETREERLTQFLEENETPVIALREAAMLRCENGFAEVKGKASGRLFARGKPAEDIASGFRLPI